MHVEQPDEEEKGAGLFYILNHLICNDPFCCSAKVSLIKSEFE